jgi:hypothetical protein
MDVLLGSLGRDARDLIRETEPRRMAALDEEGLVDLHKRIRRARNKYVGIYRREVSGKVTKKGGRGAVRPKNARNAARAEVFEDALARVSTALAQAAEATAEQMKAARLSAAKPPGEWPGSDAGPAAGEDSGHLGRAPRRKGSNRRNASSRAKGARRQAKRDAR